MRVLRGSDGCTRLASGVDGRSVQCGGAKLVGGVEFNFSVIGD